MTIEKVGRLITNYPPGASTTPPPRPTRRRYQSPTIIKLFAETTDGKEPYYNEMTFTSEGIVYKRGGVLSTASHGRSRMEPNAKSPLTPRPPAVVRVALQAG